MVSNGFITTNYFPTQLGDEAFAQQEMAKPLYSSYFGPFFAYSVKQDWTSKVYSQ